MNIRSTASHQDTASGATAPDAGGRKPENVVSRASEVGRRPGESRDLARELADALEHQAATSEVLKAISRTRFDLRSVLETLLENAVRLCAADGGVVYRFDGVFQRVAAAHRMPSAFIEFVERNPIAPGRGTATGLAALERRTVHIPDICADPEHRYPAASTLAGMRAVVSVPMLREGIPIGVVTVWRTEPRAFADREIARLTAFADQASIAIENVRLYNETREALDQLEARNAQLRAEVEAHQRSRAIVHCLQEEIRAGHEPDIVGRAPCLKRLQEQLALVAATDSTVLILGETGTGKELVARAIHDRSRRRSGPMVKVNCAALPRELVESELFGHEKGAFTGATQQRRGRFELADGGTLFLDEIGELSPGAQATLLRVLQEGEFERVGGTRTLHTSARVIAATNRNLAEHVSRGEFRQDLFYRLNVFPMEVPPLRERRSDIPALVARFLAKASRKLGRRFDGVTPAFLAQAQAYDWPGNVRELENAVERAAILARGPVLDAFEPSPSVMVASAPGDLAAGTRASIVATLEDVERGHIRLALEKSRWVIDGERGAARALGINPSTLRGRMRRLGIRK